MTVILWRCCEPVLCVWHPPQHTPTTHTTSGLREEEEEAKGRRKTERGSKREWQWREGDEEGESDLTLSPKKWRKRGSERSSLVTLPLGNESIWAFTISRSAVARTVTVSSHFHGATHLFRSWVIFWIWEESSWTGSLLVKTARERAREREGGRKNESRKLYPH